MSNQDSSLSLKKDRDYVRRVIQESKEHLSNSGSQAGESPHYDQPESKLKWNKQENRFTRKTKAREEPSKDHRQTLNYLAEQR